MSYNLLRDTENLTKDSWELKDCYIEEGIIKSSSKYFSISQELILPDPTKVYFRVNYFIQSDNIKKIIVGILVDGVLHSSVKEIKKNNDNIEQLSVVVKSPLEKIKVCVLFESEDDNTLKEVQVFYPLLCDLKAIKKTTWLKFMLDKKINYRYGFSYSNLFKLKEIENSNLYDFSKLNLTKADIGSIGECLPNTKIEIDLGNDFISNHYYLAKLDFEELNTLGKLQFKYNKVTSYKDNEQIILIFKAIENTNLFLEVLNEDVLNYIIKLKHILIVDITNMGLNKEDITYLPFV